MDHLLLVKETLEKETGMELQTIPTMDGLQSALATYINKLILNDFEKLVYLLYRIDINEKHIKQLLQEATTPAGETIAIAIIERQLQKIISRQNNTPPADSSCEEEKWWAIPTNQNARHANTDANHTVKAGSVF